MTVATNLQFASISTAASGQTAIVAAPTNGMAIYVVSYVIVATSAVAVKWQSGSTDLGGAMALAANGGLVVVGRIETPVLECAPNTALNINLGGAVQVSGHMSYFLF